MPVMLRQQHIFTAKRDQQKKQNKHDQINSCPCDRTDRNIYYSESIISRKGGDAHMDKSERLIRYSMQLAYLQQLLDAKLISESEYSLIYKKLKQDYHVSSDILAEHEFHG